MQVKGTLFTYVKLSLHVPKRSQKFKWVLNRSEQSLSFLQLSHGRQVILSQTALEERPGTAALCWINSPGWPLHDNFLISRNVKTISAKRRVCGAERQTPRRGFIGKCWGMWKHNSRQDRIVVPNAFAERRRRWIFKSWHWCDACNKAI